MTLKQQIRANRWRTLWLLFLFAVLVGVIAVILAYAFQPSLLIVVAVVGFVYAIFSWFAAGGMVASARPARARPTAPSTRASTTSSRRSRSPPASRQAPPIYVVQDDAPNAFAAGRGPKTAYVAVTTGLLNLMDERELEGVIAHEISHVRNRDVRLMTLVSVLVGVIALLSDILLRISFFGGGRKSGGATGLITFVLGLAALALAPIAAVLIQLCVSRPPRVPGRRVRERRSPATARGSRSPCASSSSTRPRRSTPRARSRTSTSRTRRTRRPASARRSEACSTRTRRSSRGSPRSRSPAGSSSRR